VIPESSDCALLIRRALGARNAIRTITRTGFQRGSAPKRTRSGEVASSRVSPSECCGHAAAFPIPTASGGKGRQQSAALRGRLRGEMKLDSNARVCPLWSA